MKNLQDDHLRGIINNFLIRQCYTIVEELEQYDIDTIPDIINFEKDLEESYFYRALQSCGGWGGFRDNLHEHTTSPSHLSKDYSDIKDMYYEELLKEIKYNKREIDKKQMALEEEDNDNSFTGYPVGVEINDLM